MDFSPILPRTGEGLMEFAQFYRDNLAKVSEDGTLRFQGPVYMTNWDRTLVALIMFPIGKDKAMNARMRHAFETWVQLCADRGWGEYRTRECSRIQWRRCTRTTTIRSTACARPSRMRWIRTASCRRADMACGRSG